MILSFFGVILPANIVALAGCSTGLQRLVWEAYAPIFAWNYRTIPKFVYNAHYDKIQNLQINGEDIMCIRFPDKLTALKLGDRFDTELRCGLLPSTLLELDIGFLFDKALHVGSLPSCLTKLNFNYYFNQAFGINVLPASLTILSFGYCFNTPLELGTLPSGLTKLGFGYCFNQFIKPFVLPPKLARLNLGRSRFNRPLTSLLHITNLQKLKLAHYNLPTERFPSSLVDLRFRFAFNHPLQEGMFPQNLTRLCFGEEFNQEVDFLPHGLLYLGFKGRFNRRIAPGILPKRLLSLSFGYSFNKPFEPDVLPSSLLYLKLGFGYRQRLCVSVLPINLRLLFIYSTLIFEGESIRKEFGHKPEAEFDKTDLILKVGDTSLKYKGVFFSSVLAAPIFSNQLHLTW